MDDARMYIGSFAKQAGTTAKTVRYYEDLGLLAGAARSDTGYRLYGAADLERLRFVLGAKALGLTLEEIKVIVGVWGAGERPCQRVSQLLDEKLADLDRRIAQLQTFRDELRAYKRTVDSEALAADVPCAHVAGATSGRWHPSQPALPEPLHPRS